MKKKTIVERELAPKDVEHALRTYYGLSPQVEVKFEVGERSREGDWRAEFPTEPYFAGVTIREEREEP